MMSGCVAPFYCHSHTTAVAGTTTRQLFNHRPPAILLLFRCWRERFRPLRRLQKTPRMHRYLWEAGFWLRTAKENCLAAINPRRVPDRICVVAAVLRSVTGTRRPVPDARARSLLLCSSCLLALVLLLCCAPAPPRKTSNSLFADRERRIFLSVLRSPEVIVVLLPPLIVVWYRSRPPSSESSSILLIGLVQSLYCCCCTHVGSPCCLIVGAVSSIKPKPPFVLAVVAKDCLSPTWLIAV